MALKLMTLLLLESHKKFPNCSSPEQIRVLQLLVPWLGSSWGYYIPLSSAFLWAPNAGLSGCRVFNSGGAAVPGAFKPGGRGHTGKRGEVRREAALTEKLFTCQALCKGFSINFLLQTLQLTHRLALPRSFSPCAHVFKKLLAAISCFWKYHRSLKISKKEFC